MNKKWIALSVASLVLLLGAAWASGWIGGVDPQVAELEKLREETFAQSENLSEEQRRSQFRDFREKVDNLSEEQRRQFFEQSRPMFQKRMNERMDKFFAMTPEEQNQELDKIIDRMEQWRGRSGREGGAEASRGERKGPGGPGGRGGRRGFGGKGGLEKTTPAMRAKMDAFRDKLNERRKERGLEPRGR